MANWFGNLDLAYKYTIVFVSLLVLTILAGLCKVLYNRRRLKKHVAEAKLETGQKEDQMELNAREKDEGDLFGIRAIEAGYFAGIHQSRPTSRAGSIAGSFAESRGTSTLLGGASLALKDHTRSYNSSVTTLPLAHTIDRDSSGTNSPPRRKAPPTIRLAPSQAELSGRTNHSAAVDMNLMVPPSPVLARGRGSPTFGGSDDGSDDGRASPRSLSPRSANFTAGHYAPVAPQLPMPQGLQVNVHTPEDTTKSQAASFNFDYSNPSSRGPTPDASSRLQSNTTDAPLPPSPVRLLPQTYQPYQAYQPSQPQQQEQKQKTVSSHHKRELSSASSTYSVGHKRTSTHDSSSTDSTFNFSHPATSNRNSVAMSSKDPSRRQSASSSLLAPASVTSTGTNQPHDPRLSEFYDAYYRQSQYGLPGPAEQKRPAQLNLAHETIVEVETPLSSPTPSTPFIQRPGAAQ